MNLMAWQFIRELAMQSQARMMVVEKDGEAPRDLRMTDFAFNAEANAWIIDVRGWPTSEPKLSDAQQPSESR